MWPYKFSRLVFLIMLGSFNYSHGQDKDFDPCNVTLFSNKPGIVRVTEGATATFLWETHMILKDHYFHLACLYNTDEILSLSGSIRTPRITPAYDGKVAALSTDQGFGFSLLEVQPSDATGIYSIQLYGKASTVSCDSLARLYIYEQPAEPKINASSYEPAEGDNITLTCHSDPIDDPKALNLTYTWTVGSTTVTDGPQTPRYILSGSNNDTLTIYDVTEGQDELIRCTAAEPGSPLNNHIELMLDIQECTNCSGNTPVIDPPTTVDILASSPTLIIIGVVVGVVVLVLLVLVTYLCWERKHKPERSKKRLRNVRKSMTLDRLRRGRSNFRISVDYVSEEDIDVYSDIRASAIQSTILIDEPPKVPTLPKRPAPLEYDYADPLRLGVKGIDKKPPEKKGRMDDLRYDTSVDIDMEVKKDFDIYMPGEEVNAEKPAEKALETEENIVNEYSVVNKRKTKSPENDDEDEETALVDNKMYHASKDGDDDIMKVAQDVKPPASCRKTNSYIGTPKRDKSEAKPDETKEPMRNNLYSLAGSDSDDSTSDSENAPEVPKHLDNVSIDSDYHSPVDSKDAGVGEAESAVLVPNNVDIYSLAQNGNRDSKGSDVVVCNETGEDMYHVAGAVPED